MTHDFHAESSVASLRRWVVGQALPLWGGTGYDSARGSFVERLAFDGAPLTSAPRRAMVQARQIYVFSHAALLGWWPQGGRIALEAAHNLINGYHGVDGAPGWIFSIHPDGAVCDAKRDLYAHSFALFGLAWAYKLEPEPHFLSAALTTLRVLDQYFASPLGGHHSAWPADAGRHEQNPHMHLFEAMLAWFEATGRDLFLARARELYNMMTVRFFRPETGILTEYFDGSWNPSDGILGRICEPGHHFEWSWLLRRYAAFAGVEDPPVARALKDFGDRHGFDSEGFVIDELLDDGRVLNASRRCWPQTESLKAEVASFETGDGDAAHRAARTIGRLLAVFLGRPVAGGWIDRFDAHGAPTVDFIPASTLYHVFLAAAEADRVWGGQTEASKVRAQ
jgi:mannose-6-phosphate isomerase